MKASCQFAVSWRESISFSFGQKFLYGVKNLLSREVSQFFPVSLKNIKGDRIVQVEEESLQKIKPLQ
ncbi:MAG: hypothetical protein LBE98_02680 [Puniceicoccales bacterium]|nr:hypothetical protein [Puniceicoccales bacterium]